MELRTEQPRELVKKPKKPSKKATFEDNAQALSNYEAAMKKYEFWKNLNRIHRGEKPKMESGGKIDINTIFAHPERFMKYDGRFLYPPRIEYKLQPSSLDKLDNNEYVGQVKLNGSSTSISISKDTVVAKERHNTFFAIPPKFDFQSLHRGSGFMCLTGEFMNKTPQFRGFCIWDILSYDDKILIGSTIEERIKLIDELYPAKGVVSAGEIIYLYKTEVADIYKVNNFYTGFHELYDKLTVVDLIEGFCLKRKSGKLELGSREQNNISWQVKVRKPASNYQFADGGITDNNKK